MEWIREGIALPTGGPAEPDCERQWRPWVLEEDDGTLRMWYSGHDGATWRILEAVDDDGIWERRGVVIDAGFAGDTDDYGVQAPCVVKTPGGYLMAYAGFDGETTRLHMASSPDGHTWEALGTFMQRGEEDRAGASHPSLLRTGEGWWLFYSGYDGSENGRRAAVLAAVSGNGASWDRVGPVLHPLAGEVAASHPCVLEHERRFHLFFAADDGEQVGIARATSADGVSWERHGPVLAPTGDGPDGLAAHAPCVVRLRDGSLRMWYSALPAGDTQYAYRICSARFRGRLPGR